MKKWMIAVAMIVILVIVGILAFRSIISGQIMDGDGMENPFPPDNESEETRKPSEEAKLVAFRWHQNAMSYGDCFTFLLTASGQEPSDPRLYCSYSDMETGERIEVGDEADGEACQPVSLERWTELSDFLRNTDLPAYRRPDPNLPDATDSGVQVTWRDGDEEFTGYYDGRSAHQLLKLLQDIAGEAYRKTTD